MRKIEMIVLHCTATPEGMDVDVKMVDKWHRARGFKCIGYHYLVKLDGSVEAGRSESEIGAHCKSHNRNSIGIAYAGGLDGKGQPADTRTEEQKVAIRGLVNNLRKKYGNIPVHGHNEFAAKACPCFDVRKEKWQEECGMLNAEC